MSNMTGLSYSPDGAFNKYIYCKKAGYIHFFVEDTGKEYVYEKILERMFHVSRLSNFQIFPMGGKNGVEDAFRRTSDSSDKVFCIADGDFDLAIGKQRICAENFVYLKRYNIESYYIHKPAIIAFMRDQLEKPIDEAEQITEYEQWECEVIPYLKKVFALHCLVQIRSQLQQTEETEKNVGKNAAYFLDSSGHPKIQCYNKYIADIQSNLGITITDTDIDNQVVVLEDLYGSDIGAFVCGKYLINGLVYYLRPKTGKNLKEKELKDYLVSNFDISLLDYLKEKIVAYIA